jgi:hypothetical protein
LELYLFAEACHLAVRFPFFVTFQLLVVWNELR